MFFRLEFFFSLHEARRIEASSLVAASVPDDDRRSNRSKVPRELLRINGPSTLRACLMIGDSMWCHRLLRSVLKGSQCLRDTFRLQAGSRYVLLLVWSRCMTTGGCKVDDHKYAPLFLRSGRAAIAKGLLRFWGKVWSEDVVLCVFRSVGHVSLSLSVSFVCASCRHTFQHQPRAAECDLGRGPSVSRTAER